MNLRRMLPPEQVRLRLQTPVPRPEEGETALSPRALQEFKEWVLEEMVELLGHSGRVGHTTRLLRDMVNRERKASTAVGHGVAFPHVRTQQAKEILLALALAPEGIPFDTPDGKPVHLVLAMVSPWEENRAYLGLLRRFSEMFHGDAVLPEVLAARDEHEVIRVLSGYL